MDTGIDKAKLMQYKANVQEVLSDPVKLRLITVGGLLVLTIALVYIPLSNKIDKYKKLNSAEKERNNCIVDCEKLQKDVAIFHSLIGEKSDTNEWVQYLLSGMSKFKIKLRGMESKQLRKVGLYKAIVLSMEIEGSYPELKNYVEWVESSERLVRIDLLQLSKGQKSLLMKIMVLGVMSKK
jgi:hypothetical protein